MEYLTECNLCYCTIIIITGLLTWCIFRLVGIILSLLETKKILTRKHLERENGFLKLEGRIKVNSNEKIEEILSLQDEQLMEDLQSRKLSAVEVLDAYIFKALEANRKYNCITEFIPQAQEWAEALDNLKNVKGPLHGVPISVKDNCDIEGLDSTLGLAKNCFKPAKNHAVLVKTLLDLGAVPFCKTNVPQTLMSFGCINPVFGETKNPLNVKLSPGGSSGGESTLIASGGSIIGVASDAAGSSRIPAHFTGIVGFKPSMYRLSPAGVHPPLPEIVGVAEVPGLMAKNIDTMIKTFHLLVDECRQNKYDAIAMPLPWNDELFNIKRKLKVGYFTNGKYFPLVGDSEKVVSNAVKALEYEGHEMIPFEMPDGYEMSSLFADLVFADQGAGMSSLWKGEIPSLPLFLNLVLANCPIWLKNCASFFIKWIPLSINTKRGSTLLRGGNLTATSAQLWKRLGDRKKMLSEVISQWKRLEIDLLLCPTFPFPAIPLDLCGHLPAAAIYLMVWNLFDFPSGVVKFGIESGENVENYNHENDFMLRIAKKATKCSTGMPISVQVIGLPYQDELVLRGMKELSRLSPISAAEE